MKFWSRSKEETDTSVRRSSIRSSPVLMESSGVGHRLILLLLMDLQIRHLLCCCSSTDYRT